MNDSIRVFVNTTAVDLPAGSDAAAAVGAADQGLLEKLQGGLARLTDGRGIELDPATRLSGGAILRVVVRAKRGSADVDA
jgi:hypothetical protein